MVHRYRRSLDPTSPISIILAVILTTLVTTACNAFIAHGVTINRPPRDGRMAFIRTPDGISIELLQAGGALLPAEPWISMANTGYW